MPTANELIADRSIGHQVDLQHYANGVVRKMIALLNRSDADLFGALQTALDSAGTDWTVERLESLLQSVRLINAGAYSAIGREIEGDLAQLVAYELDFQAALFRAAIPAQIIASAGLAEVNVAQVAAAALARPFQGRLLREWARDIDAARMVRIRDAVRIGFVEQQTTAEIVKRIRGTRAKAYSDGLIEIDRRSAESIVRTAVAHTSGYARDRYFERNGDIIKALGWSATLDTRTSETCRVRDGKQYEAEEPHKPIGHKLPWLGGPGRAHWCCRSCSVPVLKNWRELTGVDLPEFSPATRASMDGQVAADQTYGDWLKRQSAARQDEVLGPTRGALYRGGGLAFERFYNDKGRYLSLAELRARDAAAFKRARL